MTNLSQTENSAAAPVASSVLNGIMTISMNNPSRMNALSLSMMESLSAALDTAECSSEIKVVLIRGEGKVFCAGHDLKELTAHRSNLDKGREHFSITMKKCSQLMQKIMLLSKPVIAVVTGTATAAGCQLVATCDLAFASPEATFCTPGVNIGLFCSTPMVALSRNLNRKQSMEMLLTGENIDAEKAKEFGLINRIIESASIAVETQQFAESIASKSANILKIGKEAFYRQIDMNLEDAYEYCAEVMVENMLNQDAQEGINAFLAKRAPVWHNM